METIVAVGYTGPGDTAHLHGEQRLCQFLEHQCGFVEIAEHLLSVVSRFFDVPSGSPTSAVVFFADLTLF